MTVGCLWWSAVTDHAEQRHPFSFSLIWSLYPAISGQAIPSAFSHFRLAETQWNKNENKKVTMSFNYSGNRYWYVRITDTEFENIYLQYPDGNYNYRKKCLLAISLGDIYVKKKNHYKLIAKVIEL